MTIREQESYVQGLEDMYMIIKRIFELTTDERQARFGSTDVPTIMDKFDFIQIRERIK